MRKTFKVIATLCLTMNFSLVSNQVLAGGKVSDCNIISATALFDKNGEFNGEPISSFINNRQKSKQFDTLTLIEHYSEDGVEKLAFGNDIYYRYNLGALNYQNSYGQILKVFRKRFDGDTVLVKLDLNAWREIDDAFSEVEMWRCRVSSFIPETAQERADGLQKGIKRGTAFRQYLETLKSIDGYCRDEFFCQ